MKLENDTQYKELQLPENFKQSLYDIMKTTYQFIYIWYDYYKMTSKL